MITRKSHTGIFTFLRLPGTFTLTVLPPDLFFFLAMI